MHVAIAPNLLTFYREYRQLSVEEAAERIGVPAERLIEYEANAREVSVTMLKAFSSAYGIPEPSFARSTPPRTMAPPRDFRTFDSQPRHLSAETLIVIDRVRDYLSDLQEISALISDSDILVPPAYGMSEDARPIASEERSRLGIRIEEQIRWRDTIDAFRSWRAVIESSGVAVFAEHFPLSDCRGFSLYDNESLPAIVVNWDEKSAGARIFSLAHEYGHIISRSPGISDTEFRDRNNVERFCNQFAAEFLMPVDGFARILGRIPATKNWSASEIRDLASRFHVSQQSMALRLEQLELAPFGFYNRYMEERTTEPVDTHMPRESRRFHYAILLMYRMGFRYTATVLDALDQGQLTQVGAAKTLGISPKHFDYMRNRLTPYRVGHGGQ